jgi:hypothetical protein
MISASIKLDKRTESKKGYPIKICVTGYAQRKWLTLGMFCHIEQWNNGLSPKHPHYKNVIQRQSQLLKEVEHCHNNRLTFHQSVDVISNGIQDKLTEIAILEKKLAALKQDAPQAQLFPFWDKRIQELTNEGKTVRGHLGAFKQFADFLPDDFAINDITYELLMDFRNHKYSQNCNNGGIATYLKRLKTIYLEAQRRESLSIKQGNPFKGAIPETVTRENIKLSKEELTKLRQFVPNKNTSQDNAFIMMRRVYVWLFQLYIGGHDMVDVARLTDKNIKNGRITFKRYKNRNKGGATVDNILIPEALEILNEFASDKGRLFPFIPLDNYEGYRKNTNRALNKISGQLELEHILRSKSPRYIFKQWATDKGCDFLATKQVQGQTVQDVSMRYLSGINTDLVDAVIFKVFECVNLK